MRRLLAMVVAVGAVAGCADVTRVREPDGSAAFVLDCGSTMPRLESCRHAALRLCPAGYQRVPSATVSGPADNRPIHGVTMIRCLQPAPAQSP